MILQRGLILLEIYQIIKENSGENISILDLYFVNNLIAKISISQSISNQSISNIEGSEAIEKEKVAEFAKALGALTGPIQNLVGTMDG